MTLLELAAVITFITGLILGLGIGLVLGWIGRSKYKEDS